MAMTSGELTRGAAPTWRTVPAGEIGRFRGGSGFPLRFQGQASGEIPFFKVSDMNLAGNEKHMTRANHYISEAVRKQLGATLFPTGSIVFAKVGAAVFLERKRILAQPSCIDNNMAAFVLDASRADIEFVHQLLLTTRLADLVSATALPALNGADLAAMPVSLPPIDCQREVAKVLRGPDALLAKLDQLIAKKRDLKQAAMRQLLTGRTRLPGYADPWRKMSIGSFADVIRGVTYKSESDLYPNEHGSAAVLLRANNVREGAINLDEVQFVDQSCVSDHQLLRLNDILICMANGSRQLVGKAARLVQAPSDRLTFGAFMGCLRIRRGDADPRFVAQLLQTLRYRNYVANLLAGSSINNLRPSDVAAMEFDMPPLLEQRAIADLLADMDTELAALEARRDKTRLLKQGMMQALLTGRIRLV